MKIISFLLLILVFSKCTNLPSKENTPFTIIKATHIESAKEIKITIDYSSKSEIDFLNIFFKEKKMKLIKEDTNTLSGVFYKLKNVDLQLHGDPKKEFGNTMSKKEINHSFNLKDNEAIISYKDNGEVKYYTIKNIQKK